MRPTVGAREARRVDRFRSLSRGGLCPSLGDPKSRRAIGLRCSDGSRVFGRADALDIALEKAKNVFLDTRDGGVGNGDAQGESCAALFAVDEATSPLEMEPSTSYAKDTVSSEYIDSSLLKAMESMSFINQMVLFGCNLDTRSYRLDFPSGKILFDVAPEGIHAYKSSKLKKARTPPGCLHVPIPVPAEAKPEDLDKLLARKGFQGTRPSMWTLEDMDVYCSDYDEFENVVVHVTKLMALDSFLVGSLGTKGGAGVGRGEIADVLASCNLRGQVFGLREYAAAGGGNSLCGADDQAPLDGWVFFATQMGRSLAEQDVYQAWTQLAEEVDDEEYFDNFQ